MVLICMIRESFNSIGVVEFPTGFSFACLDIVHKFDDNIKRVLVLARSIAEPKCRRIAPQDHLLFGVRLIAAFDGSLRAQWGMALHIQCIIFVMGLTAAPRTVRSG